jgi:hypothetical protein
VLAQAGAMRFILWAMVGTSDRSNTPLVVVLVAVMGLLSTIGAAALGGYWANKSVERQFESQRSAAIQDQRRQVYADYLQVTTQACDAYAADDTAKFNVAALKLLYQEGRVLLIGGPSVREAEHRLTHAIALEHDPHKQACSDNAIYFPLRDAFIDSAKRDLE